MIIRNYHEWINCKKVLSYINGKRTTYIISPGMQKYIVNHKKLEWITNETRKLSPDFLTKHELDKIHCEDSKKIIKNSKKFKEWIDINLLYKEEDFIRANFLERVFKLNTKSIYTYESDNSFDYYVSNSEKQNKFFNFCSYDNIREHYLDENNLLTNKSIISKKENRILKYSFMNKSVIIGYENLIKDPLFNLHFYNSIESLNNNIFAKFFSKNFILLNEKDIDNIQYPQSEYLDILLYPERFNINDVLNTIT